MPIIKHQLSFDGGEWSPWLDGRTDLAKYGTACRRLENFILRPQGGVVKRPGLQYLGQVGSGANHARLIEFEVQSGASLMLVMGGGTMKVFSSDGLAVLDGEGAEFSLPIPWSDSQLAALRWAQVNDVLFVTHPEHAPRTLKRHANAEWTLEFLVSDEKQPFLPENLDENHKLTVAYPAAATPTAWASAGVIYEVGSRVTHLGKTYKCQVANVSSLTRLIGRPFGWLNATYNEAATGGSTPGNGEDLPTSYSITRGVITSWGGWRMVWLEEGPQTADSSALVGQQVTVTSSKAMFLDTEDTYHTGALLQISQKRQSFEYEALRAYGTIPSGADALYSNILKVDGRWTFQTAGTWYGKFSVEESTDRGSTWRELRGFSSSTTSPRNASAEGQTDSRVLMRVKYSEHSGGTTGAYGMLSVEDVFMRGSVKILSVVNETEVLAEVVTPVENGSTQYWAEGSWSDLRGWPRAIEIHQGRLILASTKHQSHTVWGSATDDYNNFRLGTDADGAFAHTVMIGQREPITWLVSDRVLVIGSGVGEFILRGETDEKPITPEFGTGARHSSFGSHSSGPGALQVDSVTLFVQSGGRVVRELSYRLDTDRYESGNLTLLSEHLFRDTIDDFALMRNPFTVVWFVSGGRLYGLTYERGQNIAGWHRHTTAGTVMSVACLRRDGEDEVWLVVERGGALCVERFALGAMTDPQDDGRWMDSFSVLESPYDLTGHHLDGQLVMAWHDGAHQLVTLNSAYFAQQTGLVTVGLPYTAKLQPMTPETALANGSSRTREARIHAIVPSLYLARGGAMGEAPDGTMFDPLKVGAPGELFTGETDDFLFDGGHSRTGNFCIVSNEPYPFGIRSLALKLNYSGDAR